LGAFQLIVVEGSKGDDPTIIALRECVASPAIKDEDASAEKKIRKP